MEERVQAAVLLQRLLRGRASQNMMFEGKERSLELITELRATENVKEKEREMSDQMAVEARQRQQVCVGLWILHGYFSPCRLEKWDRDTSGVIVIDCVGCVRFCLFACLCTFHFPNKVLPSVSSVETTGGHFGGNGPRRHCGTQSSFLVQGAAPTTRSAPDFPFCTCCEADTDTSRGRRKR